MKDRRARGQMKRLIGFMVIFIAMPSLLKAQVCVDTTTYTMNVDTSAYVLEVSTKTLKADMLAKAYLAMADRDRYKNLWLIAVNDNLNLQGTITGLYNQVQALTTVLKSTSN
jgi:hypothetical protein